MSSINAEARCEQRDEEREWVGRQAGPADSDLRRSENRATPIAARLAAVFTFIDTSPGW